MPLAHQGKVLGRNGPRVLSSPLQPVDAVVPLPGVVMPAVQLEQGSLGKAVVPPVDHWPTGQKSQAGPPRPAGHMT